MSSFNPLNVQLELRDDVELEFHQMLCDCPDIGGSLQDLVEWYLSRAFDKFCRAEKERQERSNNA